MLDRSTKQASVDARTHMMNARLEYTKRGWWTFPAPADGSKKSLKSKAHSNGVNWGATKDVKTIAKEFRQRRFRDQNIGIPTGIGNRFFVVEVDTKEGHDIDGAASLQALEQQHGVLPETLMACSPSNSIHRYFKHPGKRKKVKTSASEIAPGVDVRGDGGMVLVPPSVRPATPDKAGSVYSWVNAGHEIAEAPLWLLDLVIEKIAPEAKTSAKAKVKASARNNQQRFRDETRGGGWAAAALKDECETLRNTPDGRLNEQLNTSAFSLGQIVGGGGLKESDVFKALMRVGKDVKLDCENGVVTAKATAKCKATIKSGLSSGMQKPRTAPPLNPSNDEAAAIKAAVDDTKQKMPSKSSNVGVSLSDFYALMPSHDYIFVPSRESWPASSVNSRIKPLQLFKKNGKPQLDKKGNPVFMQASTWLDKNRPIEMMTWAPGMPLVIADKLINNGGWVERQGVSTFNLYMPPSITPGIAKKAKPWVDLVRKVYPDDADEIFNFLAHRVQRPHEKINHSLVLGGDPGIGKDTMLEALKHAVGPWNFIEVSPQDMMAQYNDFMRSVVLRISEVRDLGEVNRFSFYDHMKTITATPPDVMRVNAKYIPQHYVLNVSGVIYTTNYKTNGIYLPADDRRTYVAWSELTIADFPHRHWLEFWNWYQHQDGLQHVAAYLAKRDISGFDAKAPPLKTPAFWAIVDANAAPEESELADAIDKIGIKESVDAITLQTVICHASGEFQDWLEDRKNRRAIPHRFEKCGYVPVRSETEDHLWVINGKRQVVYARKELSLKEQHRAVQKMIKAKTITDPKTLNMIDALDKYSSR